MKVRRIIIPREEAEQLDQKQTAIIVQGDRHIGGKVIITYRLVVRDFSNRNEAWQFCQEKGIKGVEYDKEDYHVVVKVKLLALNKALRAYDGLTEGEKNLEIWKITE